MLPAAVIESWLKEFEAERRASHGWPVIWTPRRDASNLALLLVDEDTPTFSGFDALRLGPKLVKKQMGGDGARSYRGILYAINFCHELRKQGVTCTQRELYYNYKGPGESPWRTQAECNESIADAAAIFEVPRFALGLTTAARGMCAGLVRWRASGGGPRGNQSIRTRTSTGYSRTRPAQRGTCSLVPAQAAAARGRARRRPRSTSTTAG